MSHILHRAFRATNLQETIKTGKSLIISHARRTLESVILQFKYNVSPGIVFVDIQ